MAAVKKIIPIRNSKVSMQNVDIYEEQFSPVLESAIIAILNEQHLNVSLEELYRIVENLHTQDHRTFLYENLQMLLEQSLIQKLDELNQIDDNLLKIIETMWLKFCKQIQTLRNIFLSFDRSPKNCKYNTVHSMSMNLFKVTIILNSQIRTKITAKILHTINCERDGYSVNRNLVKSILAMLSDLQIYDEVFQKEFLMSSEEFYRDEAKFLIIKYTVPQYLGYVNRRINEEHERSPIYMNKYTIYAILDTLYRYLIRDHVMELLNEGFDYLIDNSLISDMSLMYSLFKKVLNGTTLLVDYFIEYILKNGNKIIKIPGNEKCMIQQLLDFKDKLDNVVAISFKGNSIFYESIRNCFIKFINNMQNKPAQLLAKYVDRKLRSKDVSDKDLEVILSKVMILFRFIQGKDVFEAFYKRDLSKRLLLSKSTSQDAEDSMITKLKLECGAGFTSKIEGMFKDISISQNINVAFKQYLNNKPPLPDLCINVLTSSFWPNYPNYEVNLPPELTHYQVMFQKFYATNHSGRKLLWQPNLGYCVVKACFDQDNKELLVSLFQTLVLLLFNCDDKMSFKAIKEATDMDSVELKRTLLSLACGRSRVLLKQPKGKDINDDDEFVYNNKFTNKLFRVRINQIQLKETAEEEKATQKSVIIDRQFQIDAAIVRIMKKVKTISHNQLLSELFNTLDIPVKPHDLKKRIEMLIEREYMERDRENVANYIYIA